MLGLGPRVSNLTYSTINRYYKVLAAKPAKVKDGLCLGNAGKLNYK